MLKNTSFVLSRSCRILKQKKNQTGSYDLSTFHITKTLLGFSPSPFRPSMPNILCYKNTTNSCEILFSFMLGWKWTQFPSYSWKLLNNSILFLLKDQSTPLLEEKKKQSRTRQNKKFYFDSSIYRGTYPVLILDHLVIWKPCNRKMVFFYVVKKYNGLISTKQSEVLNQ